MARIERSAGFIIYFEPAAAPADPALREYLLLDYGRHWDFPKGHLDAGEDDLTAARRELREETGIKDVQVIPGFQHEIAYYFRDRKKGLIHKTVIFFLARVKARDVRLSHEHVGYEFLTYDRALKQATYPTAKQVLRLAHAHLADQHADKSAKATQ